jgi:Arc/MetJ family transcription regulator
MRTNIVIDDELVKEAMELTGIKTKRELVNLALQELVVNRKQKDLRDLKGIILFDENYDYKAAREGK